MLDRARAESGFLLLEVVAAIAIISIALLALMAGYDSAFLSLHRSNQQSVASTLANQQLELYRSLPYASIGLDAARTTAVGSVSDPLYDSLYATNSILDGAWSTDPITGEPVQAPGGTVNEVTIAACGTTAPNCLPIQTVTGPDGRSYRIETFVRDDVNSSSNIRWTTRDVTVTVRDPSTTGDPKILSMQTGFDRASAG